MRMVRRSAIVVALAAARRCYCDAALLGRRISYFAFGSNMHPAVLTGRRGVTPLLQRPAAAEGWRLGFSLRGGGGEPSFASAEPDARKTLYGSLVDLAPGDWAKVCATEGVPLAYLALPCRCRPLDAAGNPDPNAEAVWAYTLTTAPGPLRVSKEADEPLPSERYLSYLRSGARLSGLPAPYRAYLDGLSRDPGSPPDGAIDPADAAWLSEEWGT